MAEEVILRESSAADSADLGHFFSSIPLQGIINLKVQRQVDFFSLYRRLQVKFHNYIIEENQAADKKEILGTATFLNQNLQVADQSEKISFGCDLRISPQRKAILNWSKYFLPQIEILIAKDQIKHFITTINLSSSQVMNAFIRTKSKKTKMPFYELVRKFNLVSVHGFYPLISGKNPFIKIDYLTKADHAEFIKYLELKLSTLDLVPTELNNSIEDYVKNSLIYSMQKFIIAKDAQGKIVGCCYALSSSLLQDYFPQAYEAQANNFRQFLKLASFLGLGRTLTKPFSRTQKDQTLNFQFLHFLNFEHPEILKALIEFSFDNSKQNEFIIYAYEQTHFQFRPPHCTIHSETPYALYEMRTPDSIEDHAEKSLKQKLKKSLWLDGFLI